MKITNCCGVPPYSNGDSDASDIGICPECKEHCDYIDYCDECGEEECVCKEETPVIELSPYDQWQLNKYGNVLNVNNIPDSRVFENGFDDLNRFSEWMAEISQQQTMKDAEYYGCKQDNQL